MTKRKKTKAECGRSGRARRGGKRRLVLYVSEFHLEEQLMGVVDYAREAGWRLHANMRFHGLFPHNPEADGIIAVMTGTSGDRVRNWLAERRDCPIVRMSTTPFHVPYPAAEADYEAAGRVGARHLLELGHIHYAFYWTAEVPDATMVRTAFEAELAAAGRRVHRLDFPAAHGGRTGFEVGLDRVCRWLANELKHLPRPLAIMTDDDRRALEIMDACEMAGLRVPDEIAILGCDNHQVEVSLARVSLSSVDMNFRGVGREAAALLARLMNGEELSSAPIRIPPAGVVARRSTATFVTDSPAITAAVVHLRQRFREPLRLTELARQAGMSERAFRLEFKQRVGRTAREELLRARLACVARLLRDTDLKLEAIAAESGFGSAPHLCRFFGEVYGLSPDAWRQKARAAG